MLKMDGRDTACRLLFFLKKSKEKIRTIPQKKWVAQVKGNNFSIEFPQISTPKRGIILIW
jgi:hypothetical protein